jgi:hypothetical protein
MASSLMSLYLASNSICFFLLCRMKTGKFFRVQIHVYHVCHTEHDVSEQSLLLTRFQLEMLR